MWVEFRRAAGQIDSREPAGAQHFQGELDGGAVHHFGTARPGVDVAVHTGLVAPIAKVDLQRFQAPTPNRREVGLAQ